LTIDDQIAKLKLVVQVARDRRYWSPTTIPGGIVYGKTDTSNSAITHAD